MKKKLLIVGFKDNVCRFLKEHLPEQDRDIIGEYPGSLFHLDKNFLLARLNRTESPISAYENVVIAPEPSIYMPAVIPASGNPRLSEIDKVLSHETLLAGIFMAIIAPFLKPGSAAKNMFIMLPDRRNLDISLPYANTVIPLLTPLSGDAVKLYGTLAFSRLFGLIFLDNSTMAGCDDVLAKLPLQPQKTEDPFDWLYGNYTGLSEWPNKLDGMELCPTIVKYSFDSSSFYPSAIGIKFGEKNIYLLPYPDTDEDSLEFLISLTSTSDTKLERYHERLMNLCSDSRFRIKGTSMRMKQLCRNLLVAGLEPNGHVLLVGESGSGKELSARAIHDASRRKGKFIAINCALLSEALACSEIFGHEAGSFTGAIETTLGAIGAAKNGSLFLDEIHLLPLKARGMLLRIMESPEYSRMGSQEKIESNVRIIAATNLRDMTSDKEIVSSGFFQRFRHFVNVPALRYHRQDISEYINIFLESEIGKHKLSKDEVDNIMRHVYSEGELDWTRRNWRNSNIRGLKSEVENRTLKLVIDRMIEKDMEKPDASHDSKQPARGRGRPPGSKDILDDDLLKLLNEANTLEDLHERLKANKPGMGDSYIKTMPRRISSIYDPKTRTEAHSRYEYLKEQSKISRSKQKL